MKRRALAALLTVTLFGALMTVASPARAEAPVMSWDASIYKGVKYVNISCFVDYGPWSTWRSPSLPVTGSWVYKSTGSPGLYPDYAGEVQCTVRAYTKSGKIYYPAPVNWSFTP